MNDNHQTLINLLKRLYGNYTEQNGHVDFNNYHSKEIAQELGYDESSFSRILNPPIGKETTSKTYQRLFTRIETKLQNKQLKEQVKTLQKTNKEQQTKHKGVWMLLALLALIAATFGYQKLTDNPSNNGNNNSITECRLTRVQRHALNKLYGEHIQYKLVIEALIFRNSINEGVYKNDLNYYIDIYRQKLGTMISDSRTSLKNIQLLDENGNLIGGDFFEKHAVNKLDRDMKVVMPSILNPAISPSELKTLVMQTVSTQQKLNFAKFDSIIVNQKPLTK